MCGIADYFRSGFNAGQAFVGGKNTALGVLGVES